MFNHRSESGPGRFILSFSLMLVLMPVFTASANPEHQPGKEKSHAPLIDPTEPCKICPLPLINCPCTLFEKMKSIRP
jgi:hypothetical protein